MEEKKNADDNILMISDVDARDDDFHADDDFEKQQEDSRLNISPPEIQESERNSEEAISSVSPTTSYTAASSLPPAPPVLLGLGRGAPLLKPTPRRRVPPRRVNGNVSQLHAEEDPTDETSEKLQLIRVKFLRLAHRLGQTPRNVVVAQFLYRLGLPELSRRTSSRVGAFTSINRAISMAQMLEAAGGGQDPLDFSCTIMLLGKTGVGKSATINSIFGDQVCTTDAFQMGTKRVHLVEGFVQGIKVRVIDTPGLSPSWFDQHKNKKTLKSIRAFINKSPKPPDVLLYLDRLDTQKSIEDDMLLLRTITHVLGPSIWSNAIVGLTHAASAPPEGAASSYDMFVTRRCHAIQQDIRQAAGDVRLVNPRVALVENHPACRTNRAGQRVLPNGQAWKPHLLLLSFASKILAEENALQLKLQGDHGNNNNNNNNSPAARSKAQPLSLFLSSLLEARPPQVPYGDDEDEESDQLPPPPLPFKRLTEAEISRLSRSDREQYRVEFEHQADLEMEEEKERRRPRIFVPRLVPVPIPIWYDTNSHHVPTYPPIEISNRCLIVAPVQVTPGWDHDIGYNGIRAKGDLVNTETMYISYSGQVTENQFIKEGPNVQLEMASLVAHGEEGNNRSITSLGFEMQKNAGDELSCTLRSNTDFRKHKASASLAVTLLGDSVSAGVKAGRELIANKRFGMNVYGGGAMTCRGDPAFGGGLESQFLGRFLSSLLGLYVVYAHGGLVIGGNLLTQVPIGRSSDITALANMNSRGEGKVNIRADIFELLEHAMAALVTLFKKLLTQVPIGRSSDITAPANLNNRGAAQVSTRANICEHAMAALVPLFKKLLIQIGRSSGITARANLFKKLLFLFLKHKKLLT